MVRPPPFAIRTTFGRTLVLVLLASPAAAAEGGLQIFPDQRILYLIVLFAVLIVPVNKLLFQPILRVLDERRERIESARARADDVAKRADDVLARYEDAVRRARDDSEGKRRERVESARREQAEVTARVRADSEERTASVRQQVAESLAVSRAELRRHAEGLAEEAASRVLGRPL